MKIICGFIFLFAALSTSIVSATSYEANIDFAPRTELSIPVSGVVKKVNVTSGQVVTKHDVLLSLDAVPLKAEKDLAQSHVTALQTRLTESQRDLKHKQELFDRTVLSLVELQDAELREKRDRAQLETARAQLVHAAYNFDSSRLLAPFDALILSVHVNQEQFINNSIQSTTLVTLVRSGQYQAKFQASIEMLNKIKIDQAVSITSNGKEYAGKISSIDYQPLVNAAATGKKFAVTAIFTSQDSIMPVGNAANVHID
jgi:RND family efflux transporter MFP subunit